MGETNIEWTDRSVNPIRARLPGAGPKGGYNSGVGHYCEKISAGCKNCYSSTAQPRFGLPQFHEQRNGAVETFFDADRLTEVLRRKKPTKFFWCDMTDMFGSWVPFEWVAACFGVMAATPQHTHQILTKRPERAVEFFAWLNDAARGQAGNPRLEVVWQALREETERIGDDGPMHSKYCAPPDGPWPLPNVHLGVSCENQDTADERIPLLKRCPASVRWISAEPLLGPINLATHWTGLRWLVVGGESGPGARPFDLAWARSIVGQCKAAGVACFVKQLGSRPFTSNEGTRCEGEPHEWAWPKLHSRKGGDPAEWPVDLRVRQWPGGGAE